VEGLASRIFLGKNQNPMRECFSISIVSKKKLLHNLLLEKVIHVTFPAGLTSYSQKVQKFNKEKGGKQNGRREI
jgi:hypothetical protein